MSPYNEKGSKIAASEVEVNSSTGGTALLDEVAQLTGLPESWVKDELREIVEVAGHAPQDLTLDQLRVVMMSFLEAQNAAMCETDSND